MSKLTKMTSAVAAAGVGLDANTPIVAQAKEVIKVEAVVGTRPPKSRCFGTSWTTSPP